MVPVLAARWPSQTTSTPSTAAIRIDVLDALRALDQRDHHRPGPGSIVAGAFV
jgi:hypothetical protein